MKEKLKLELWKEKRQQTKANPIQKWKCEEQRIDRCFEDRS